MRVFSWNDIENFQNSRNPEYVSFFQCGSALTIGGFDGPHRGHEVLCDAVLASKRELSSLKTGVITFNSPPKAKNGIDFPGEVSTLSLRLSWFKHKGFDFAVVIDFSHKFSTMSGTDFLSILYMSCAMRYITVGDDFKCGYKGETGIRELRQFSETRGISVTVIHTVSISGLRVSSSAIRQAVAEGQMKYAEQLLGRPYAIDGEALVWKHELKGDIHTFVIDNKAATQVLPPEGRYDVSVLLSDMTVFNTVCCCENDTLRLSVSHPSALISVRTIEFI